MVFIKGKQEKRFSFSAKRVNKKLSALEGFLNDEEARVTLYEFLRNNVAFAANLLLGISLFPFQCLMLRGMLLADYTMYVLSRGAGKSFLAGVYVILECLFNQGAKMGIIGPSFRQSKFILQKAEDILAKPGAKMVKDCGFKLQKGTDAWTFALGLSRAIALPLANGERLRGFRFSQILLDEFLGMPERIFNEVILPFLGVIENPKEREDMRKLEDKLIAQGKMKENERYRWPNNKLMILSSPSYEYEFMYEVYKQYCNLILGLHDNQQGQDDNELMDAGAYRLIWKMAYDTLPPDLYDKNLLNQAKATMSEAQFLKEFGANFSGDSGSYFSLRKMHLCTIPDGERPCVEIVGKKDDEYILAFDPSWSESDTSDDFAMQVGKIDKEEGKIILVHSYALAGSNLNTHMKYLKYLLDNFNIKLICGDYNGAVSVISACKESEMFSGYKFDTVEVDFDKPEEYFDELVEFKKYFNKNEKKYYPTLLRKPTTTWITFANQQLQANIDHKKILFAARPSDVDAKSEWQKDIDISELKWDNHYKPALGEENPAASSRFDFLEHQKTMIERTKNQCAMIEVKINPQGSQSFGLPSHMKKQTGPNKARKDSYSSLILLNWAGKLFIDMGNAKERKKNLETFLPFTIV